MDCTPPIFVVPPIAIAATHELKGIWRNSAGATRRDCEWGFALVRCTDAKPLPLILDQSLPARRSYTGPSIAHLMVMHLRVVDFRRQRKHWR
jgi:hypothetical protein